MNLDQFIKTYTNQFIDVDKEFGPQCWDLVELYAELLRVPKEPWAITLGLDGAAHEAWTVFDAHMQRWFDKIPVGQQQRGDINVYGPKPGFLAGHICIELGNGTVFQQNATIEGSPAHVEARGTSYFLGSLRLKENIVKPWREGIIVAYQNFLNTDPTEDQIARQMGQPDMRNVYESLMQDAHAYIEGLLADAGGVNHDTALKYVQDNLK